VILKRRDPPPLSQRLTGMVYPKGGWTRAFHYVRHRLRRLPDPPERIARGVWAGVFTAFTPFYGLHFVVAFLLARLMRGNALAALMSTFFGNPLTYVPIGVIALETGHFLLGSHFDAAARRAFGSQFIDAGLDMWNNILALFTSRVPDWTGLQVFYDEIFLPYMVGGLVPGVVVATAAYLLTVPLIRAYQQRRRAAIKSKFDEIKARAAAPLPGADPD
jgi:uncharacterized protein (DUF2062 family)